MALTAAIVGAAAVASCCCGLLLLCSWLLQVRTRYDFFCAYDQLFVKLTMCKDCERKAAGQNTKRLAA